MFSSIHEWKVASIILTVANFMKIDSKLQFYLVFLICLHQIEFRKAKISIFRCQHASKRNANCSVANISNQIWMRFSGKHLNYFRRNFVSKSVFWKSKRSSVPVDLCSTLPAFIFCKPQSTNSFSFLLCYVKSETHRE